MNSLRGATTIENNTEEEIREAVLELWDEIMKRNGLESSDVTSLIISCTEDIDAAYPGKFVRLERGLDHASILHFNEMKVKGALKMCIRLLIELDIDKNRKLSFVYLRNARKLRPDLSDSR